MNRWRDSVASKRTNQLQCGLSVGNLVLCGGFSEYCVASSVKEALDLSYQVCLVADGHISVSEDEEKRRAIIARQNAFLTGLGGDVVEIKKLPDYFNATKLD